MATFIDAAGRRVTVSVANPLPVTGGGGGGTTGGATAANQTGTGASAQTIQGASPEAAADTGNPVKVGGVYNATLPTYTSGQRVAAQYDARGSALARVTGSAGVSAQVSTGLNDGGTVQPGMYANSQNLVFNGATWDRARGDTLGAWVIQKGGASLATAQVAVTTTSTQVVAARANRQKVTISSTSEFFVGASGVTVTTGFRVPAGGAITLETAAAVFAVGAANLTAHVIDLF